jgi:hypothetical protein
MHRLPILYYTEVVDFGLLSASNKTVSKKFKIKNIGALDANFTVSYKGDAAIKFFPSKDVIPPYSEIEIRVKKLNNQKIKIQKNYFLIFFSERPICLQTNQEKSKKKYSKCNQIIFVFTLIN